MTHIWTLYERAGTIKNLISSVIDNENNLKPEEKLEVLLDVKREAELLQKDLQDYIKRLMG